MFTFFCSTKAAADMAEHFGMGINEGGTFVPKIKYKKHLDMMVIPRPLVKEVDGVVSYVSTLN